MKLTVEIFKARVPNHHISVELNVANYFIWFPIVAFPVELLLPGARAKLTLPACTGCIKM
jgi:hypothetical protein